MRNPVTHLSQRLTPKTQHSPFPLWQLERARVLAWCSNQFGLINHKLVEIKGKSSHRRNDTFCSAPSMASLHLMNILSMTIVAMVVVVILPAQLDAYYTQNTGCHHNGTWYADKSLVPTTEKCLNCQCTKKTLVCRLKVCPEMPMPPPRGCVVVQKKNTCCPYLSCARLDAFYKIPATRRIIAYLDHYERESIDRVVNDNMLQRRSDDTDVDLYVCVKNGTVYKSGSAMSSSNLCSYCYCIGGTEKCVKPKCMLPLEGCKPIFVDSTCCPVRYDCSTKQTGKSSQEVRYRKTSNKHYVRMSQRLQRNRGCTVGQQFYAEGQKMKSDKDKPCDICFCIRGQRKCAPKKCAPALRNCIPVVPKGQCCPSSYDCGSQRDYRRSQNSRQFNLYSLFFGKDEDQEASAASDNGVQYPHDRHPQVADMPAKPKPGAVVAPTTDKSIFDTLREGLEFIDNNNNHMLKENLDLVGVQPSPTPIPLGLVERPSTTTELSFLDLLLGPSEANTEENSSEEAEPEEKTTAGSTTGLSWVDLLLAPHEEVADSSTVSDKIDITDASTIQDLTDFDITTSIDRVDHNNFTDNAEELGVLTAEEQDKLFISTTDMESTTEPLTTAEDTTQTLPTTLTETTEGIKSTEPIRTEVASTTKRPPSDTSTVPSKKTQRPMASSQKPIVLSSTEKQEILYKTEFMPLEQEQMLIRNVTQPPAKPGKGPDFLSALLDGLSGILGNDNQLRNSTSSNNKTTIHQLPTPKPMPFFKPLPSDKTYTRINSKIANLTVKPPVIANKGLVNTTFKPLPQQLSKNPIIPISENLYSLSSTKAMVTTTTTTVPISTTTTTTTVAPKPTTASTSKPPVVIKTNPTILDSEPLDRNAEHTLPPSLPNLKIIPFLPTDAVKADHNKPSSYDYYHHAADPTSRIDYDQYDDANIYPSITEKYPLYPDLEDGSKAEYIYKFNVEGPDSLVSSTAGKFDGTLGSPAFVKYDFVGAGLQAPKGFSPPTKTEGGFVPKDPLILDDDQDNVSVKVGDSYQVTQHIIDITTPGYVLNTTKVIEITTPDPFKDVIRTELPPDLTSLIEDKLKNLITQSSNTTTQPSHEKAQIFSDMDMVERAATAHFHKESNRRQDTMTDIGDTTNKGGEGGGSVKITQDMSDKQTATMTKDNAGEQTAEYGMSNADEQQRKKEAYETHAATDTATRTDDVSTIPPFKSLPQAVVKHLDKETTSPADKATSATTTTTAPTKPSATRATMPMSISTGHLQDKQTTLTSTISATSKRPVMKNNRNKTIAHATSTARTPTTTAAAAAAGTGQQQLKLTKNKQATHVEPTETKILPSNSTANAAVSSSKTKANATRRVTSPKPTRHYKPTHRPTATNTAALATAINPMANNTGTATDTAANTAKGMGYRVNGTNVDATSAPPGTKRTGGNNRPKTATLSKKATTTKVPMTTKTTTTTVTPVTTTSTTSTASFWPSSSTVSTTTNPFLMSPFDKLPFMDASFEVKRNSATPSFSTPSHQTFVVAKGYDDTDDDDDSSSSSYSSSANHGGHEAPSQRSQQSSVLHGHTEVSTSPPSQRPQHQSLPQPQPQPAQPHLSLNNLIDPTGILKLAGCNIYGRMYRVGRIILELSSPCQECKCTEIGVKCGPLDC